MKMLALYALVEDENTVIESFAYIAGIKYKHVIISPVKNHPVRRWRCMQLPKIVSTEEEVGGGTMQT